MFLTHVGRVGQNPCIDAGARLFRSMIPPKIKEGPPDGHGGPVFMTSPFLDPGPRQMEPLSVTIGGTRFPIPFDLLPVGTKLTTWRDMEKLCTIFTVRTDLDTAFQISIDDEMACHHARGAFEELLRQLKSKFKARPAANFLKRFSQDLHSAFIDPRVALVELGKEQGVDMRGLLREPSTPPKLETGTSQQFPVLRRTMRHRLPREQTLGDLVPGLRSFAEALSKFGRNLKIEIQL